MDVAYFDNVPSTVENLSVYIWNEIKKSNEIGLLLYKVRLEETVNNSCEYYGEMD